MTLGRDTLKGYFKAGSLPTQDDFYGLIDSMLHMEDEGFRKTRENGLEVTSALGKPSLLTFYRKENESLACWTVRYGGDDGLNLHPVLRQIDGKGSIGQPLLSLRRNGCIGIGTETPAHKLEVTGFVASEGRAGTYRAAAVKPPQADGEEYVLATGLTGCVAFEVVASASGADKQGRYAVMHAIAMNAYNPSLPGPAFIERWFGRFNRKRRIRTQNAWYGERCDRIELKWRPVAVAPGGGRAEPEAGPKNAAYELVICTKCKYGEGSRLEVSVTQLWPLPQGARTTAPSALAAAIAQARAPDKARPQKAARSVAAGPGKVEPRP